MEKIIEWISNNKEWLFDGLGVVLLSGLVAFLVRMFRVKAEGKGNQTQYGGDDSVNIQTGRNLNISFPKEGKHARHKKSNKR